MGKDNWGFVLKRLREQKGFTQKRLAEKSGVKIGYISKAELGVIESPGLDIFKQLSHALGMTLDEFNEAITGKKTHIEPEPETFESILNEFKAKYEALKSEAKELVEIPIRGSVPAGVPFPVEQESLETLVIPRQELGSMEINHLFALKVSGNSLSGDGIFDKDYVIVNGAEKEIVNGKIYVVRIGAESCVRHVFEADGHLKLVSSDGEHKDIKATDVTIIGRVEFMQRLKRY